MSSTLPSTKYGPPFDYDDADIILRSSDKADFHVHKIILSTSSPFFKSMFSLPQPNAAFTDKHHPIIDLLENNTTIAALLAFIYPAVSETPEFDSLDEILNAIVAATKFEMAFASRRLNQLFAESKFVKDDPIVAFGAAYSRKLGDAARIAAMASLKHPMNLDKIADKLLYVDGVAFHHLYKFHRACSATAAEAAFGTHLTWITESHRPWWDLAKGRNCTSKCPVHYYSLGLEKDELSRVYFCDDYFSEPGDWAASAPYHNFITRAHNVLLEHPCREAVTTYPFLGPFYEEKVCGSCQLTLRGLPEFSRLLGEEVERRVSEVDLELPF